MTRISLIRLAAVMALACAHTPPQTVHVARWRPPRVAPVIEPVIEPPAAPSDPELVVLEATASNEYIAAGAVSRSAVRLRVSGLRVQRTERPPINLGLVVDTSGSMEGAPIEQARAACDAVLSELGPDDRISIVAFHTDAEVIVASTRIGDADLDELREHVAAMRAQGTTNLAAGLYVGLEQLAPHVRDMRASRLVLLSDGIPDDATAIEAHARQAASMGVTVTALGLGLEYDPVLLGAIAQNTGGTFHYVRESNEIARVFREEVTRVQEVVARNVRLRLRTGPGVSIAAVDGQPTPIAGRNAEVIVADVSEGRAQEFLVRLDVPARTDGGLVELLDASLTFEDAVASSGPQRRRAFVALRATSDAATVLAARNVEIERAAVRSFVSAMQLRAIELARGSDLRNAHAAVDEARRALAALQTQPSDPDIDAQLTELTRLRATLRSLVPRRQRMQMEPMEPMAAPVAAYVNDVHARAMQPFSQN